MAGDLELVFEPPKGEDDALVLSQAVYEAGFEDALVGTGHTGLVCVGLEIAMDNPGNAIFQTVQALIKTLPPGTILREIRMNAQTSVDLQDRLQVNLRSL